MATRPELIMGTAQLTTDYGITRPRNSSSSRDEALELLRTAHNLGIRTLDTAPAYGDAESRIGECTEQFTIHTKLESGRDELESLSDTLARLNVREVDLLYVHDVRAFERDPHKTVGRLEQCLSHGANAVAVSIYTPEQMEIALTIESVSAIQFPLNVLDRRFSRGLLDRAKCGGYRCIARSAFLQGVLLSSADDLRPEVSHLKDAVKAFRSVAKELEVSPLTAALGWVTSHAEIDGVIVGISTMPELREVHAAWLAASSLSADAIQEMEDRVPQPDGIDPRFWDSRG